MTSGASDRQDPSARGRGAEAPSASAFSVLARLLRPYRWRVVGLSALIAASAGLAQVAPQFVRYVFDVVIPEGELRLFLLTGAVMAGYYIVSEALAFGAMYLSFAFTQQVISDTRHRAYRHLLDLPMRRFTAERSGSLVSRVVSDVNALESMIQAAASRIVGQLFSIIVVIVILFVMNWVLALVALVLVAAMAFFTIRFQEPLRVLARRIRGRVGEMSAVATEAIGNIGTVKVFTAEEGEFGRFRAESDAYRDLNMDRRLQVGYMQGSIGLTSEFGTGAIVLIGGWLVASSGTEGAAGLTIGTLTAFLLYLSNLLGPVRFVLNFNNVLQSGVAALERIDELLSSPPEEFGAGEEPRPGDVVFADVSLTYPEADEPALRGLSFAVDAGTTAALVGPSGAGKSTVIRMLSRLYDPDDGAILVGGDDIRTYDLGAFRRHIAVVPQDPTLFSGTVAENIRYGRPDATNDDVREAAELANARGFIDALPNGFETAIGERGVKLSGGQKQRVAIARAILKQASVLVLDEATSSLDSESEAVIQDALEGLFSRHQEVTSIVIAHRLSTIRDADRIFVLQDGRVVEEGSHPELIERAGLYRRLHDLQTGQRRVAR